MASSGCRSVRSLRSARYNKAQRASPQMNFALHCARRYGATCANILLAICDPRPRDTPYGPRRVWWGWTLASGTDELETADRGKRNRRVRHLVGGLARRARKPPRERAGSARRICHQTSSLIDGAARDLHGQKRLRRRLREFYKHQYGQARPHRGGEVVTVLTCLL
jgi:hypothetical protein